MGISNYINSSMDLSLMMMRLNQSPIEIYIVNRIYGSCATTWYCCVRCSSKVVVRIRISLSLASHEASVLYQNEDQVKSPSSPTWEHNGERFRIRYGRVDITFEEVLQMDCWLLLKITLENFWWTTNTTIMDLSLIQVGY